MNNAVSIHVFVAVLFDMSILSCDSVRDNHHQPTLSIHCFFQMSVYFHSNFNLLFVSKSNAISIHLYKVVSTVQIKTWMYASVI